MFVLVMSPSVAQPPLHGRVFLLAALLSITVASVGRAPQIGQIALAGVFWVSGGSFQDCFPSYQKGEAHVPPWLGPAKVGITSSKVQYLFQSKFNAKMELHAMLPSKGSLPDVHGSQCHSTGF